jgi:cyclophilin family peptidyl-prolyl cis-trans isomerase
VLLSRRFTDLCPKACDHFTSLCVGVKDTKGNSLSYEKCPIHRIVKDGWFQCGDITDGSGANSVTINDITLPDECFTADFGFELGGVLGLANTGPHSNGSQFFITVGPCDWMNNQYVGIGRVVCGYKVIQDINCASISATQRPDPQIFIKSSSVDHNYSRK